MPLQVHEDAAVGATAAEGEIVHAQDAWRGPSRGGETTDAREQGVAADRDAELPQQPCARFAAEGECHTREPAGAGAGASCMGSDEGGEPLGEGAPRAARIGAEEPTHLDAQGDGQTVDGQIGGMAQVPAVDASGATMTQRTARGTAAGRDAEGQLAVAKERAVDMQQERWGKRAARRMAPTSGERGKRRSRLYTEWIRNA